MSQIRTIILIAAVLAVSAAAFMHAPGVRGVLSGECLLSSSFYGDTFAFFAGIKYLERGLHLWNPYLFCGIPLVGDPQCQLFYPPAALLSVLPWAAGINWSFLLHVLLAGAGMWMLLRYLKLSRGACVFGALSLMFGAHVFLRIFAGHLGTLNAFAWMPLVFLFAQKYIDEGRFRDAVISGTLWGIQILAGNPQYSYYTFLAVAAYSFFNPAVEKHSRGIMLRRAVLCLVSVAAVGACLAAVRILPAWEFFSLSARSSLGRSFVSSWALPPENLLTCLIPEAFGNMFSFPYWGKYRLWEMCVYWGVLPLLLGLLACGKSGNKQARFFTLLAVLSLFCAVAAGTPWARYLCALLPGFGKFRGHSKFVVLAGFSVSALSAYGYDIFLKMGEERGRSSRILLAVSGAAAAALFAVSLAAFFHPQPFQAWWTRAVFKAPAGAEFPLEAYDCFLFGFIKFTLLVSLFFLSGYLYFRKSISRKILVPCLFVLMLADLISFGYKYVVCDASSRAGWDEEIVSGINKGGGPTLQRVVSVSAAYFSNKALFHGIQVVDGYDVLVPGRFQDYMGFCDGQPLDSPLTVKLLGMAGVEYAVFSGKKRLDASVFREDAVLPKARLERNLRCLPRAYMVYRAVEAPPDREGELALLVSDAFNPSDTVMLPNNDGNDVLPDGPSAGTIEEAEILDYSPDRITVLAKPGRDGYLVLSDSSYPGWEARVYPPQAGKPRIARIIRANYMFRAVRLSPGEQKVVFSYRPVPFRAGAAVSAATLLLLIVFFLRSRPRKK